MHALLRGLPLKTSMSQPSGGGTGAEPEAWPTVEIPREPPSVRASR